MTLSTKMQIQKLVSAALKPAYKKRHINTEQFTDINRDVSRLLYDMVAESGYSSDGTDEDRWRTIAAAEVDRSVKRLRSLVIKTGA